MTKNNFNDLINTLQNVYLKENIKNKKNEHEVLIEIFLTNYTQEKAIEVSNCFYDYYKDCYNNDSVVNLYNEQGCWKIILLFPVDKLPQNLSDKQINCLKNLKPKSLSESPGAPNKENSLKITSSEESKTNFNPSFKLHIELFLNMMKEFFNKKVKVIYKDDTITFSSLGYKIKCSTLDGRVTLKGSGVEGIKYISMITHMLSKDGYLQEIEKEVSNPEKMIFTFSKVLLKKDNKEFRVTLEKIRNSLYNAKKIFMDISSGITNDLSDNNVIYDIKYTNKEKTNTNKTKSTQNITKNNTGFFSNFISFFTQQQSRPDKKAIELKS